ncbi:hypothetical protein [Leptospira noguchii]|uniref:Uncharacterized protein n=1 Tax=Leptospira noguchii TaxID=28182 RepID=A0AAE9GD64_9LEPT|nr:hypothetical protein [Leptospira noguchii]UOG31520.1 hypothetical protein MAL06_05775 [Leptospira noguchii]UOG44165.1 hypothetical protein MAL01_12035 [Leptospira noguchii]UOG53745.1 hypothetical protein MAL09_06365 [Leptospira noguchii]UOG57636.1 hypothetical protein MAL03_05745 [Leptospira noguchii]
MLCRTHVKAERSCKLKRLTNALLPKGRSADRSKNSASPSPWVVRQIVFYNQL